MLFASLFLEGFARKYIYISCQEKCEPIKLAKLPGFLKPNTLGGICIMDESVGEIICYICYIQYICYKDLLCEYGCFNNNRVGRTQNLISCCWPHCGYFLKFHPNLSTFLSYVANKQTNPSKNRTSLAEITRVSCLLHLKLYSFLKAQRCSNFAWLCSHSLQFKSARSFLRLSLGLRQVYYSNLQAVDSNCVRLHKRTLTWTVRTNT